MNNIKYLFLPLLLVVLLTSCEDFFEQTVTLPSPEHTPLLAVHAYITNSDSEVLEAKVSRSFGLFEEVPEESEGIDGATVELYKNGELLLTYENTPSENVNYNALLSSEIGGIGDSYEIKVTAPDFETISATQIMPDTVPLKTLSVEENGVSQFGDNISTLSINFDDPNEEENYYELALFVEVEEGGENYLYKMYFEDEDGQAIGVFGLDYGTILLSDKTFNGQNFTFRPAFYNWFGAELNDVKFKVVWRSVTKDYFLYIDSQQKNRNADGNPFAEPVSVYTNFEGGIGVFALRSEHIYDVQ